MERPTAGTHGAMTVPDRQVFLSAVRPDADADRMADQPDIAVIELDRSALLELVVGYAGAPKSPEEDDRPVTTMGQAWVKLPSEGRGSAYEALRVVYEAAAHWRRSVWMDDAVLEGLGALPTRSSSCHVRETDFFWETTYRDHGILRTEALSLVDVMQGVLYVGEPDEVRAMCEPMSRLCPEVLANALIGSVGPRFGVADRDITSRSIVELVSHEELRPMLFHENARVRRAALEALGDESPLPT